MEIFNNLPVYELQDGEVDIMSLVMFPAVEKNFMKFSKEKVKLKFDDSKRVISGVAIIAGKPIYRFNPTYGEHYVVFTPELIEKLVLKFMKEKRNDSVNLEHDKSVSGLTLIESYITSPTTRNLLFQIYQTDHG